MKRTIVAIGLLMLMSGFVFARQTQITGRSGWVTLRTSVRLDGVTLKPGSYLVEDETKGAEDRVRFSRSGDPGLALEYSDKAFEGEPVVASCVPQTVATVLKKTRIVTAADGTTKHAFQLEIKGENVVHMCSAV